MTPKKVTPVEIRGGGISYTLDNRICIDLIDGTEILQFSPSDVSEMFHALLEAIGVTNRDNLFYSVDDVITASKYEEVDRQDERVEAVDEAVMEMIVELAG